MAETNLTQPSPAGDSGKVRSLDEVLSEFASLAQNPENLFDAAVVAVGMCEAVNKFLDTVPTAPPYQMADGSLLDEQARNWYKAQFSEVSAKLQALLDCLPSELSESSRFHALVNAVKAGVSVDRLKEVAREVKGFTERVMLCLTPEQVQAQQLAVDILDALLNLRNAEESRPAAPPVIPDAFPGDLGKVPNNPLIACALEAIRKTGPRAFRLQHGWRLDERGRPVFEFQPSYEKRITVYLEPPRSAKDPGEWSKDLIEKNSPGLVGDVALAMLAQLCEPSVGDTPKYPLLEMVRTSPDAILGYKGIRRYGAERCELRHRIVKAAELLRALRFDVERWPISDPKTNKLSKDGARWTGDRFLDIVEAARNGEILFWSVRAGHWAYWFLHPTARVWLAKMSRVLLEFDQRGAELIAKKMGQYVIFLAQALKWTEKELRIDSLLTAIGELPVPEHRDEHWAGRTRDRLEAALELLKTHGVIADYHFLGVRDPDDHARGWVAPWLVDKLQMILPEAAPELSVTAYKKLGAGKRPRRGRVQFDGAALRRLRIGRNWPQTELAKKLKITRPYLSYIESGKRFPSKQLQARIEAWRDSAV